LKKFDKKRALMKNLIVFFSLLALASPALASEVVKVSNEKDIIVISHNENREWQTGDKICVIQNETNIACGTVKKITKSGAYVRLGTSDQKVEVGAKVISQDNESATYTEEAPVVAKEKKSMSYFQVSLELLGAAMFYDFFGSFRPIEMLAINFGMGVAPLTIYENIFDTNPTKGTLLQFPLSLSLLLGRNGKYLEVLGGINYLSFSHIKMDTSNHDAAGICGHFCDFPPRLCKNSSYKREISLTVDQYNNNLS